MCKFILTVHLNCGLYKTKDTNIDCSQLINNIFKKYL